MDPLVPRFVIAGLVIIAMGVAIAVTGAAVGEGAVWKGTALSVMGAGFVVTGVWRYWQTPR